MTELVDAPAHPAGLNYVGGAWVPSASGETYSKVSPMRPSETTGEYSASSAADADAAVAAAAAAFDGWAALPMARRAGYLTAAAAALEQRGEEVARDMTLEMGKPLREARGVFRQLASLPPAELLGLFDSSLTRFHEIPVRNNHPLAPAWKQAMGSDRRRLLAARAILFGEGGIEN